MVHRINWDCGVEEEYSIIMNATGCDRETLLIDTVDLSVLYNYVTDDNVYQIQKIQWNQMDDSPDDYPDAYQIILLSGYPEHIFFVTEFTLYGGDTFHIYKLQAINKELFSDVEPAEILADNEILNAPNGNGIAPIQLGLEEVQKKSG